MSTRNPILWILFLCLTIGADDFDKSGKVLKARTDQIQTAAFSPDGRWLVTGEIHHPRIWNVADGQEIRSLETDIGIIRQIRFSPDSKRVIAAGLSAKSVVVARTLFNEQHAPATSFVQVWDASTGKLLSTIETPGQSLCIVGSSADGSRIVGVDDRDGVHVYEAESGREMATALDARTQRWRPYHSPGSSIACDAEARRIVFIGQGSVKFWDTKAATATSLSGHADGALSVAIRPDGRLIAAADRSGVTFWDGDTNEQRGRIETDWIRAPELLMFTSDGRQIIAIHPEKVSAFDVQKRTLIKEVVGVNNDLQATCIRQGRLLIAAGGEKIVAGAGLDPKTRQAPCEPLKLYEMAIPVKKLP